MMVVLAFMSAVAASAAAMGAEVLTGTAVFAAILAIDVSIRGHA